MLWLLILGVGLGEGASSEPVTQRRRSTRIARSIPLTVRGVDLLSQPFEERTATLAFNIHGCKYPSKHHLPKNTWVTLEVPAAEGANGPNRVRARVVWIQRPRSVREMFQIAVELETAANIWCVEPPAEDWEQPATAAPGSASSERSAAEAISAWLRAEASRSGRERNEKLRLETETPLANVSNKDTEEKNIDAAIPSETNAFGFAGTIVPEAAEAGAMDSPLVREFRSQIESQAAKAADEAIARASETLKKNAEAVEREHMTTAETLFRQWREDFDRDRESAREEVTHRAVEQMAHVQDEIAARVTGQMSWVREELRSDMKQEFGSYIDQMKALVSSLGQGAEAVRKEAEAAVASGDRLAQIKIALEAAEASVDQRMRKMKEAALESLPLEDLSKAWQQKLEEQMGQARGEWDELLQTSLDGASHRLASRLAEASQTELQTAEGKLGERLATLSQPVTAAVAEAQHALTAIRASLDTELQRARTSLVDIENAAERMREFSAQIDAASHDAVNQLHRRLDSAVQTQVNELQRHADALKADLPLRIQPALDAAAEQLVAKTLADLDTRLLPHLERVPELVRELTAHEVQAEESLRMHRERLRQTAESSRRDVTAQMNATMTDLRGEFEKARNEALARWNEEMDATGARATHSAVEGLVKNVEWHQKHAQQYIETLTQEALAKTNGIFEEQGQDAQQRLAVQLNEKLGEHIADATRQLAGVSAGVIEKAGGHLDSAAAIAAGAFSERIGQTAEATLRKFGESSDAAIAEKKIEIERAADSMRMTFEHALGDLLERYRTEMNAYGDQKLTEARDFHSRELAAAVEAARVERETQARDWYQRLARANEESLQKYEDQLQGATELWVNVAINKLNESGQSTLTSLARNGEQMLRNSLLTVLEQLTETVRQNVADQSSGNTTPRPTLVNPGQRESRAGGA